MALFVKELRLQQGTLQIALGLVILHLAALMAMKHTREWLSQELRVTWMIWLVVPLVIGSVSIADERRSRTLESALCLPVGRVRQFAVKLLVVFGLGLFLGAIMPWSLETLRRKGDSDDVMPLIFFLIGATTITAIGYYASSLSESLLQSIGAAIGFCVLFPFVFRYIVEDRLASIFWWEVWIGFILLCLWLSYANFKHLRITRRHWLGNGGILILAAIIAARILWFIFHSGYWAYSSFNIIISGITAATCK